MHATFLRVIINTLLFDIDLKTYFSPELRVKFTANRYFKKIYNKNSLFN